MCIYFLLLLLSKNKNNPSVISIFLTPGRSQHTHPTDQKSVPIEKVLIPKWDRHSSFRWPTPPFRGPDPPGGGYPRKKSLCRGAWDPPGPLPGGYPPRGGSTPPFLTKIPYFIEKRRFFGSDRCYGAFFCDTIVPSKSIEHFCVCWRSKNANFLLGVAKKWTGPSTIT